MAFNEICNKFSMDIYNYFNNKTSSYIVSGYSIINLMAILYGGAIRETKQLLEHKFNFNSMTIQHMFQLQNKMVGQAFKQISFILSDNVNRSDYINTLKPICKITKITDKILPINDFVKNFTNGLITNLLDVNLRSEMILIDVIYFKSNWKHKFNKLMTYPKQFNGLEKNFQVNMMHQTNNFMYASNDIYKMIEMDYHDNNYSFCVILTRHNNLMIDGQTLNVLLTSLRTKKINLEIPRFKLIVKTNFNHLLQNMGLKQLYDKLEIPQILISNNGIQDVMQKIVINIDEEGTEIAIATTIISRSFSIETPIDFICDRPFIFLIRNKITNTIVCIGKYC